MKVNGEAIYATTASPFEKLPFNGRCTAKPGKLYFHVFDWPKDGKLVLPAVQTAGKVYLLADPKKKLPVALEENGDIVVTVPATAPDPVASVVVVESKGNL
jgi:alpha-L-fucosidase